MNILCYAPVGSKLQSISGSGIFIDPKGIILTNAHVAQYFLLADRGVSCSIRAGSPAIDEYKASLIYISPSWIHANSAVLSQAAPIGTGEYDFALIAITQSETSAALPSSFPYIPLAMMPPNKGTPIVIASFGAQFLNYTQIQSALSPTVVFGSVKDVFTFGTNTIDALNLGGSAAAQEGSSGGGLADATGALVGTITTSTIVGSTSDRSLSAITASYIRSEYSTEMGGSSLDVLLSVPTASSIADFATQIPMLESIITATL
ncbi:MAG: serine protease [Candidatus Paceibacteria bacterium]